jgi:hypothetical protein
VRDRHALLAGLDDRFERVGKVRHDRHPQRRLAREGAEPARRVRHVRVRDLAYHPTAELLQAFAHPAHVLDRLDVAIADDDVRLARKQRSEQGRDVVAHVLVVAVGVDNVIGAELQRRVDARHECGGESLAARETDDVVDARHQRDVAGAVGRPVVHDEVLDQVDPRDRPGQIADRAGQGVRLVEARYLDDQFGQGGYPWINRRPAGRPRGPT